MDKLPVKGFTVYAAPMFIVGGSGGPCRIFAHLDANRCMVNLVDGLKSLNGFLWAALVLYVLRFLFSRVLVRGQCSQLKREVVKWKRYIYKISVCFSRRRRNTIWFRNVQVHVQITKYNGIYYFPSTQLRGLGIQLFQFQVSCSCTVQIINNFLF